MLKIAHRGASAHELENSMAAFRRALHIGAAAIEFDIQSTADGVPVVMHDARLERTTRNIGALGDFTAEQLRATVRLSNGEPVPTLAEVLALLSATPTRIYLEIKAPKLAMRVHRMARSIVDVRNCVFSSFHHDAIARLKAAHPDARTMALFHCAPVDPAALVSAAGADEAGFALEFMSRELVAKLGEAAIPAFVYTVNQRAHVDQARAFGVAGVFTDDLEA